MDSLTTDKVNVLFKARGYNANLVNARKSAGFKSAAAFAKNLPIHYHSYVQYESMRAYPCVENQEVIAKTLKRFGVDVTTNFLFPTALIPIAKTGGMRQSKEVALTQQALLSFASQNRKQLPSARDEMIRNEVIADMKAAIGQLDIRERFIIKARQDDMSWTEIGRYARISGERIRQLYLKALDKVKDTIADGGDVDDYWKLCDER